MTVNVWKSYMWTIWNLSAQLVFITVRITFIFTSLSTVHIYDFHIFTVIYSSLHGFMWNQHNDQLPVGLLAQLVEHCIGIARVMGSNPVQAWNFFRHYFNYCSSSVHYHKDHFYIQIFLYISVSASINQFLINLLVAKCSQLIDIQLIAS